MYYHWVIGSLIKVLLTLLVILVLTYIQFQKCGHIEIVKVGKNMRNIMR